MSKRPRNKKERKPKLGSQEPKLGLISDILSSADPEEVVAELASLSLRMFLEEAWPYASTNEAFQGNWHIDAMCEHLEALFRGEFWTLLINVPPRHTKSTTCSVVFPAWCWIRDPSLRVMGASYGESLSMRDSRAMRMLVQSQWYQSRWPLTLSDDQNVKSRWENNRGGWRMATSTGGAVTGEGADLLVVDDPHNVTEAQSAVELQKVIDWYTVAMPTRTGRGGRRKTIVVMQRVNEGDLSSILVDRKDVVHLCLPQEYEPDRAARGWNGWTDPRKEAGELLWPARFSREFIEATQRPPDMTAQAYAGQMQQRPAPAEGNMFNPADWKFYDQDFRMILEDADDMCWSWDMTFKDLKTATASYVVGQPWARKGANFYLGPQVRGRMGFTGAKAAVKLGAATIPKIHAKLVEDKANGSAIIEDLSGTIGGLLPIEPEGGKEARASVVEPYQKAGNIHLPNPRNFPWVAGYIEEHRVFPNGVNDDQVDATSQAIIWLLKRFNKKSGGYVDSYTKGPRQRAPSYHDPRGEEPRSERGDRV